MSGGLLGIDIGGTKVAMRVVDADGDVRDNTFCWPPAGDVAADLGLLTGQAQALRRATRIEAVGVAVPATTDSAGRVTDWPNRPSWIGADPAAVLRAAMPEASIRCGDDGDLAALAEARAGRCDNLVYVGVGTGVGGGLVIGGRPFPGAARGSCEVGHLIIDRAGPVCDCGRRGCVQAVASGRATLRRAAELRRAPVSPAELHAGLADALSWATVAVDDSAAAVAAAIIGVTELVRPDLAVVGGGFAMAVPDYVARVAAQVKILSRSAHPGPEVRRAALGTRSSLHGAVELARLPA